MSELSPIVQPQVDRLQVYGSSLMRAAIGLESGEFASMLLQRTTGHPEVVLQDGAINLKTEIQDQFGIQQIFFPDLVLQKAEEDN